MATIRDIIRDCRIDILDDFPGDAVAYDWTYDDEGHLWSNRELVSFLDDAQKEFARRRPIHDATTTEITQYTVSAGTQPSITLDSRILYVESVTLQSRIDAEEYPLNKTFQNNKLEDEFRDWRTFDGKIENYLEDMDEEAIRFIGKLDDDDTAVLSVQRMPLKDIQEYWPFDRWEASTAVSADYVIQPTTANANGHYYKVTVAGTTSGSEPTWPTDGTTVSDGGVTWEDQGLLGNTALPEINARYHSNLLFWVAHRAYLKNDSETRNVELANYYEAQFNKRVGVRRSAAVESQRQRMSNVRPRTRAWYR